jgi:hypothetical protein
MASITLGSLFRYRPLDVLSAPRHLQSTKTLSFEVVIGRMHSVTRSIEIIPLKPVFLLVGALLNDVRAASGNELISSRTANRSEGSTGPVSYIYVPALARFELRAGTPYSTQVKVMVVEVSTSR